MEIPPSRWSTAGRQRGARPYPKNELREPALGCAAYPRRASEARLRRRPVDSLEVHGTEALAEGAAAMAAAGVALDKVAMTLEASKPSSRGKKKVVKRMVAKKPVAPKKKANTKK